MRILIITGRYYPHRGGLESVVYEISQHMQAQGHKVSIITNRYPRSLSQHDIVLEIPVTRLQFLYPEFQQLKSGRFDLWFAGWFYFPWTLCTLIRMIYHFKPDIVNLHYLGVIGVFVLVAQWVLRFKLVVSLHGGDVDGEPHQSGFNLWRFRSVSGCANNITTCSHYLLQQARELIPNISPTKIHVIYNGVDTHLFFTAQPYEHHPYLVGIGQLLGHKGFADLITAFAEVHKTAPSYDLLIGGDGPERESLQNQIHGLGLEGEVTLLGKVDREQVAQLMCGSYAVVIPSRREPFGIVGLEAMASGRTIIASHIGGLVEALNGANVIWVEPANSASLIEALQQVMKMESSAHPLLTENQRLAEKFDWSLITMQYLNVYVQSMNS